VSHHYSSGFKAYFTQTIYESLDKLRQACGGAGFSAWSGLPFVVQGYAANAAYEGDNTIMAQQSGRIVIKNVVNIKQNGAKVSGFLSYLNDIDSLLERKCKVQNLDELTNDVLEEAL